MLHNSQLTNKKYKICKKMRNHNSDNKPPPSNKGNKRKALIKIFLMQFTV